MAAAAGTSIFVFGGNSEQPSGRVFRFEVSTGAWTTEASLPEPRAAGGAALIGESIYIVGGLGASRLLLPSAYAYEISTRTWRRIADLPTPREHLAVVAYRGAVCALGGRLDSADQATVVECYDPSTDRWSSKPSLPRRASDFDASALGGAIWAVGDEVQVFDGSGWWLGPPLAVPRFGVTAATVGTALFVIGGAARRPAPDGVVERLDLP